jgi:hypothetical protein
MYVLCVRAIWHILIPRAAPCSRVYVCANVLKCKDVKDFVLLRIYTSQETCTHTCHHVNVHVYHLHVMHYTYVSTLFTHHTDRHTYTHTHTHTSVVRSRWVQRKQMASPTAISQLRTRQTDSSLLLVLHGPTQMCLYSDPQVTCVSFHASCADASFHASCADASFHASCADASFHASCADASFHASCADASFHASCADASFHASCADASFHASCADASFHASCADASFHAINPHVSPLSTMTVLHTYMPPYTGEYVHKFIRMNQSCACQQRV